MLTRDTALGITLLTGIALAALDGQGLVAIALIVGIAWVIPLVWKYLISKTFESDTDRLLLLGAAIAAVCGVAYLF